MNGMIRIDRQALAIALVVGIAYLGLGAVWPLAIGAGALVYALKAALDLRVWHRTRRPSAPAPLPGTPEALWVARGERALMSIQQLRRSARSEAIAQRCASIATHADASLMALRQLAHQGSVVSAVGRPGEIDELRSAEQNLRTQLSRTTGPLRTELERTLASIAARRQAAERLDAARRELHRRMEGAALGLEEVVARLAEIVALSDAGGRSAPIEDLVSELDALGTALAETEELALPRDPIAITGPENEGG
jgi:hypothetical protein